MAEEYDVGAKGANFRIYMVIFVALSIFTALSFLFNEMEHWGWINTMTGATLITIVAVIKAVLVAMFFMHLKWDFGKVYFVLVPISILAVMMMFVFMPDMVLAWHQPPDALP